MDALEVYQNSCRICLDQPALLDWNEEIPDSYGAKYKYCYYKYTQLEEYASDPFPQTLCESCSHDLKNFHFLIQKALESHYTLQQTLVTFDETYDTEDIIDIKEQIEGAGKFETVFFEKSTESLIDVNENNDFFPLCNVETSIEISKEFKKQVENKSKVKLNKNQKIKICKTSTNISTDVKKEHVNETYYKIVQLEKNNGLPENFEKPMDVSPSASNSLPSFNKIKDSSIENKKITCAYCPKLFLPRNLKPHEDTHKQRERNVVCPKCGVKFYDNSTLYSHMMVHKKDREKKFKCEFCDKSYYNSGALSLHKRKHLGKMIYCPICSKEFYRQHELNKHHIAAHSAALSNANVKKNKYLVECKDCGKNIVSHNWKHHQLLHSNNFQMKCTLCDKHFASKTSCHKHVRRFHKYTDDFTKVVEYYGDEVNKRSSFLLLKQTELVKPILEDN